MPVCWILLGLCAILHFVNEVRDDQSKEVTNAEERLREEAVEKQKKRLLAMDEADDYHFHKKMDNQANLENVI